MGEISIHSHLSFDLIDEISTAFDQVLAECDHFLTKNYLTAVDGSRIVDTADASVTMKTSKSSNGKSDPVDVNTSNNSTVTSACTLCGRKFLPERLVSAYRVHYCVCVRVCVLFYHL